MSSPPQAVEPSADIPYYRETADERSRFEAAYRHRLPLLLKGPTGCGKTRFVAPWRRASAGPCTRSPATTT